MLGCMVKNVTSHVESASTMNRVIISTAAVYMDVIQATMESIVQKVFSVIPVTMKWPVQKVLIF